MEDTIGSRGQLRIPTQARLAPPLAAGVLLLLAWALWLSQTLPATHTSRHWAVAWAGFDVALAVALAAVAYSALRRSPWLVAAGSASGTLLLVDAWFDVLTARGGVELTVAALEAAFVELPLAAFSFWIVRDAEHALLVLYDCLQGGRRGSKRTGIAPHPTVSGC